MNVISKTQIKLVKSLGQQKFRQKYGKFTAEGEKSVTEFLKNMYFPIEVIYFVDEHVKDRLSAFCDLKVLVKVSLQEMEQMSSFRTPSNILAVLSKKENTVTLVSFPEEKTIYLDDIQDPGNMGTIIRIADWFGIKNIVRSPNSADFFNPKVVQSTMGSLCNVRLMTSTLSDLVELAPGMVVLGALMDGTKLHLTKNLPEKGLLVIGNEGHGIHANNLPFITHKIAIAGDHHKVAESLNAAMACSIICHHWSFHQK
ncbi:MAG: RNA methyltransferase [Saprospiraceae bacterium]|nr:RNA methyltransferase [Saprospiraceae bacterium]